MLGPLLTTLQRRYSTRRWSTVILCSLYRLLRCLNEHYDMYSEESCSCSEQHMPIWMFVLSGGGSDGYTMSTVMRWLYCFAQFVDLCCLKHSNIQVTWKEMWHLLAAVWSASARRCLCFSLQAQEAACFAALYSLGVCVPLTVCRCEGGAAVAYRSANLQ